MHWPATLEELKKLDFTSGLSGYGDAYTGCNKIDYFQAYLRDVWTEVGRLKQQGLSAEETAKRANMTKHQQHFPGITKPGLPLIGVQRMYALMDAN